MPFHTCPSHALSRHPPKVPATECAHGDYESAAERAEEARAYYRQAKGLPGEDRVVAFVGEADVSGGEARSVRSRCSCLAGDTFEHVFYFGKVNKAGNSTY